MNAATGVEAISDEEAIVSVLERIKPLKAGWAKKRQAR
jgi:hypothetical protein